MSTDDPNPSDLPPAVRETLDSLGGALGDIAELDKEQLNETIGLLETLGHDQAAGILRSRREVLKGAGAATGLGIAGLAGATATGGARAQSDTETGTIGNGNQDADLQDVSAESVNTGDSRTGTHPVADVTHPDYAAHGDGESDDTQAILDALNAAESVVIPEPENKYRLTDTIHIPEGTELYPTGNGGTATDPWFEFDGPSSASAAFSLGLRSNLGSVSVGSTRTAPDINNPWSAVELRGDGSSVSACVVDPVDAANFEYGINLHSVDSGVGYNYIRPGELRNVHHGIRLLNEGGFTNANNIHGGRIANFDSAYQTEDSRGVKVETTQSAPNNNQFYGVVTETIGMGFDINGVDNTLVGCRAENMLSTEGYHVVFRDSAATGAASNYLLGGYFGSSPEIVAVESDGTEKSHLGANYVMLNGETFTAPGNEINFDASGFDEAMVRWSGSNNRWEFEYRGTVVATIDISGNLELAGSITENAQF